MGVFLKSCHDDFFFDVGFGFCILGSGGIYGEGGERRGGGEGEGGFVRVGGFLRRGED